MKLGLKFPERLTGILYPVREALEDLIIGIEKGWSQEHLGTGQHGDITATSIGQPAASASETAVLAVTSGMRLQQGPLSLSRAFVGNTADLSVLSPPQITATTNDYAPAGLDQTLVIRLNVDAARTITGLRRPQPTQARLYWLINTTASVITLTYEGAGSAATNRFYCPGGTNYYLPSYGAVAVLYDPVTLRWRVLDSSAPGLFYNNSQAAFGTTSPAGPFQVEAGDGKHLLLSEGITDYGEIGYGYAAGNKASLWIGVNLNSTSLTPAQSDTANTSWYIRFNASADTCTIHRIAAAGADSTLLYIDSIGNVSIGGSAPSTASLLDLVSTTATLVIPRMTTTQKNAMAGINGMLVYDTTLAKFQGYEGGTWTNLI